MVAVIEDLGSQYRVESGDTIDVDLRDVEIGAQIEFDKVQFVEGENGAQVGAPYVDGAKVIGTVVENIKGPKVIAAQFRRRKDSRRRVGHRQNYLRIKIENIEA